MIQSTVEIQERLRALVGLRVRHRTWGDGVLVGVTRTAATAFPGGVIFLVSFGTEGERGSPFSVEDLWGGVRFQTPVLADQHNDLRRLLEELRRATPATAGTASPAPSPASPTPGPQGPARSSPATVATAAATSPRPAASASTWAKQLLERDDWILVDTETTGFDGAAEVIDLAVLDRRGTVLLETLLRPGRPIPYAASRVHGLYDRDLQHAPTFAEIWPQLRALLSGRTLVAYNVEFDARLLKQTAQRHGCVAHLDKRDCVMRRYVEFRRALRPHESRRSYSLEDACAHHGIPPGGHRALADCRVTHRLIRAMAGE